jgi:hypothetical protein
VSCVKTINEPTGSDNRKLSDIIMVNLPITYLDKLLGLQEDEAPRIPRQSAREGAKVQSYAPAAFTSQEITLVLISVRG